MRLPRERYDRVEIALAQRVTPADPLEAALAVHLTAEKPPRSDVGDAYDIYADPEHRAVIEAFLLADATPQLIERVLKIPVAVTEAYRYLFFDQTAFRNKLEILGYVAAFEGSSHSREVLRAAVSVGLEYLLWVYGQAEVQVDSRTVIRHTMAEAYYRGMAHRGNSLTSGVTKEAHRWWGTAVKNAELLERIDPRAEKQAFEEIRIQLEKVDDTYQADDAPVDVTEILH